MNPEETDTARLFSYGSLQLEAVQIATFGRTLAGQPDVLTGYRITLIPIRDEEDAARIGATHYRNIAFTGNTADEIEGMVLTVTRRELEQADVYEAGDDYHRMSVRLRSGTEAWVYRHTAQ
ncbi:MAG: gamma-glutamylcyclotransferase family protein [Blastocatellia bacterium]